MGKCRTLILELRSVTMKRKNPIDFGGSRSKGGARGGGSETPFRFGFRSIAPERGGVGHSY